MNTKKKAKKMTLGQTLRKQITIVAEAWIVFWSITITGVAYDTALLRAEVQNLVKKVDLQKIGTCLKMKPGWFLRVAWARLRSGPLKGPWRGQSSRVPQWLNERLTYFVGRLTVITN